LHTKVYFRALLELVPKLTHEEKIEIFVQRAGKKHRFFTRKPMNLAKHKPEAGTASRFSNDIVSGLSRTNTDVRLVSG
jgi:hypothetical protein